eukprot:GEMP01020031.1.p1 GENE.GEMP01020031.1~~GEMP01020031.1.p1  ORF type:complete len:510 (+),score=131.47 GEMP01020031.1:69-1598(+)
MDDHYTFGAFRGPTGAPRADDMPIVEDMRAVCHKLRLKGRVYAFGSYASGFKTAKSDCDIVYLSSADENHQPVDVLKRIADMLPEFGFHTIVTVFQARVPLIKAVLDVKAPKGSGPSKLQSVDVDMCVDNVLGFHNTRLMGAYHQLDPRVGSVGLLVKQWARAYELLNSSDGHMNSYAWTLLTIFYLMNTDPPVVPNLQDLADKTVIIRDSRWGVVTDCHCEFWSETHGIPKSRNSQTSWQLLYGFLLFYSLFDWDRHCVSIRLALTDKVVVTPPTGPEPRKPAKRGIPKTSVMCGEETWCVEDPFDLRHNLAANSTVVGRKRMLDAMRDTLMNFDTILGTVTQSSERSVAIERAFLQWCPLDSAPKGWYMKCRVNLDTVTSKAFLDAFSNATTIERCYFPKYSADRLRWDAFLEFSGENWRKKAHTCNETVVNGWQLRLLNCSYHCLPMYSDSMPLYDVLELASAAPAKAKSADGDMQAATVHGMVNSALPPPAPVIEAKNTPLRQFQ